MEVGKASICIVQKKLLQPSWPKIETEKLLDSPVSFRGVLVLWENVSSCCIPSVTYSSLSLSHCSSLYNGEKRLFVVSAGHRWKALWLCRRIYASNFYIKYLCIAAAQHGISQRLVVFWSAGLGQSQVTFILSNCQYQISCDVLQRSNCLEDVLHQRGMWRPDIFVKRLHHSEFTQKQISSSTINVWVQFSLRFAYQWVPA